MMLLMGKKTEKGRQLSQGQICRYPDYNQHYSLSQTQQENGLKCFGFAIQAQSV